MQFLRFLDTEKRRYWWLGSEVVLFGASLISAQTKPFACPCITLLACFLVSPAECHFQNASATMQTICVCLPSMLATTVPISRFNLVCNGKRGQIGSFRGRFLDRISLGPQTTKLCVFSEGTANVRMKVVRTSSAVLVQQREAVPFDRPGALHCLFAPDRAVGALSLPASQVWL